MTAELSNSQIIQSLKAKAQRYLEMAAALEGEGSNLQGSQASLIPFANAPLISFEDLMKHLDEKQGRVNQIAKRINNPEDHIRGLIKAPNSRYEIKAKGWVKPKAS